MIFLREEGMPRLKLDHKKEYIQLVIDPEDKSAALEAWWAANDTSMSVYSQEDCFSPPQPSIVTATNHSI